MNFPSDVSSLAHDVRNVLSPALLAVEAIEARGDVDRKLTLRIQRAIDRTVLLCSAAMSEKQGSEDCHHINSLRALLQETAELAMQKNGRAVPISVSVSGPDQSAFNADAVFRLVFNLTDNAAKALNRNDGWVKISVVNKIDTLKITVSDNGPGVPERVIKRAFGAQPVKKTPGERVGIGLPSTVKLVRSLGGKITHDERPAGGAHFEILLDKKPQIENLKQRF